MQACVSSAFSVGLLKRLYNTYQKKIWILIIKRFVVFLKNNFVTIYFKIKYVQVGNNNVLIFSKMLKYLV